MRRESCAAGFAAARSLPLRLQQGRPAQLSTSSVTRVLPQRKTQAIRCILQYSQLAACHTKRDQRVGTVMCYIGAPTRSCRCWGATKRTPLHTVKAHTTGQWMMFNRIKRVFLVAPRLRCLNQQFLLAVCRVRLRSAHKAAVCAHVIFVQFVLKKVNKRTV